MASYWLGAPTLDRWVLRSLRKLELADLDPVYAETCRRMLEANILLSVEIPPSKEDVWCSLKRLIKDRKINAHVRQDPQGTVICYQVDVRV